MRMINICTHPIHGRCFLWEKAPMEYALGTATTNYMKFIGWSMDEVVEKITKKGFRITPWADAEKV